MKLKIEALPIQTRLGVYPEEQEAARTFTMDVELDYDAQQAVAGDDLDHAIDYDVIEREIRVFAASRDWKLVETLAYETAKRVAELHILVHHVAVTVHKPQAMNYAKNVSLTAVYETHRGRKKHELNR